MLKNFVHRERVIHSIKTVLACILGTILAHVIGRPGDQWIVVTIIVVMCAQIYLGGVMQKAYFRFLGTLSGCLFATLVLLTVGATKVSILGSIALSSFIFSYISTQKEKFIYVGTLGAVTTAIIMLGQKPTVIFALQRFIEISLGVFIAALVSKYVLPIRAVTHLRHAQAETLTQLLNYYDAVWNTAKKNEKIIRWEELDEIIVQSLIKQRQLAKECASEPKTSCFDHEQFLECLYCEREILRAITFMHHALTSSPDFYHLFIHLPSLHQIQQAIQCSLGALAENVASNAKLEIELPSLRFLKEDMLKKNIVWSEEHLLSMHGLMFSTKILLNNLNKLSALFYELYAKPE